MFTQKKIKETILGLEHKYPVDTWLINGIHIWPYVRIKLYIHMLVLMNEKPLAIKNGEKTKSRKSFSPLQLLKKNLYFLKAPFVLIVFFLRLKRKRIVFFGSHIHRILQDGVNFNRFYDSMIDFHRLENEIYTIEYQKINEPIYNRKSIILLNKHLDYYKFLKKVLNKLIKKKAKFELEGYDSFLDDLVMENLNMDILSLRKHNLIEWTNKLRISNGFFNNLFKCVKPEKVIFLGYYGLDDLYSALVVANNLKIKTIDFQHGPQTNVHLAFSNWDKIPKKGFNTMPIEFWNWDKASKNNIDVWAKKTDVISSRVVGQPYLGYWLSKNINIEIKRDCIFYSLQTYPFTIKDILTPKMVLLIKENKYKWVLRLHPRNNLDINELNTFLYINEIDSKVVIQDAYSIPLPKALLSSLLHITNYSGCLIEAVQLRIPTLLVNEVGKEMFSQYIDNELVYFLDQSDVCFVKKAGNLIFDLNNLDFNYNSPSIFNPLV
ncbi:hypothetical protein VP395_02120 [Mariniflexile soesokkakense]|uniref:Surface carbohydrate biosynthesis protein n=1 Tax=Mariniflexile soesokkakense TaxID=1343160 RepID=A0ABV0A720_9FLAO